MIFLSNWQHEDEMCCMMIVYRTSTRLEGLIYTDPTNLGIFAIVSTSTRWLMCLCCRRVNLLYVSEPRGTNGEMHFSQPDVVSRP